MVVKNLSREQKRLQEVLADCWTGLGDTSKIVTKDIFSIRTKEDLANPFKHVLRYMRNPDYFHFTCKHVFNVELLPFQLAIMKELWIRKYPMLIGSRGMSKSFLIALYSMLRALLCQGQKIVIVGSAFRQSKVVFEYCENIWLNAPILRDIIGVDGRSGPRRDIDRCTMKLGDSIITALPLGNGEKIRGQRANCIISDEFHTIPMEIYENVVSGFAAVSASPVEQVKHYARIKVLKDMGKWSEEQQQYDEDNNIGNQAIISGTAYYGFNHFAEYWKRYKAIIQSKGDKNKLAEVFKGQVPASFNWKDYSIMRIPYELLPYGFMDDKHVSRSKATRDSSSFHIEYCALFPMDSNGFFRRSLIEACVTKTPIRLASGDNIHFHAQIKGDQKKKYVYAIDPASEKDNFSIIVLELAGDHRKIVYCWTTTRNKHRERVKSGSVKEQDFYGYCARKVRDLMKVFPAEAIALDSQGGGVAVEEALHDPDKLKFGEKQIWRVPEEGKERDSDHYQGEHILHLISFADAKWVSEANHGMKKDFEDRVLLLPFYDPLSVAFALEEDKNEGREYDTLEDCVMEIEELKDELATIVHTQTGIAKRDHWDTPEIKEAGGKKGRLRKDRYSSLLMANMVARTIDRTVPEVNYVTYGGFAGDMVSKKGNNGQLYQGPAWFVNGINNYPDYGAVVRRSGV